VTKSQPHPTETEQQLSSFFEGLDTSLKAYREVRKSFDRKIAFDFNSVDFFSPGENKTSEILAFFINPHETHGQQGLFLNCFLDYIELKEAKDLYKSKGIARVELEHRTDKNRRIDITIQIGDNDYWIGIENKVGTAADQKYQIAHYADYLQEKSNGQYTLFYLTPNGETPSEYSVSASTRSGLEGAKKLQTLSYSNNIIDIFEQFESQCEADNVRAFIRDFNKHLKRRFKGELNMSEDLIIKNYALDHPAIFNHIDQLHSAINQIRLEAISHYYNGIIDRLKSLDSSDIHFCEFTEGNHKSPGSINTHTWTLFKRKNLKFRIGYSSKQGNPKNHIIIAFLRDNEAPQEKRVQLNTELRKRRPNETIDHNYWVTWHKLKSCKSLEDTSFMLSLHKQSILENEITLAVEEILNVTLDAAQAWEKIQTETAPSGSE
jgi:hypothetical protein